MIDRIESGRRLRAAREALGLSQGEAAGALGMSQAYLSDIEVGKRVPGWTRMVAIVAGLGLDPRIVAPEWFAGDRPPVSPPPVPARVRDRSRPRSGP